MAPSDQAGDSLRLGGPIVIGDLMPYRTVSGRPGAVPGSDEQDGAKREGAGEGDGDRVSASPGAKRPPGDGSGRRDSGTPSRMPPTPSSCTAPQNG